MILYLWEQSAYQSSTSYLASKWPKFFFLTDETKRTKPYIEAACCLKMLLVTGLSKKYQKNTIFGFKFWIYYLLIATIYWLSYTFSLLFDTFYPILFITWYLLLGTFYLIYASWYIAWEPVTVPVRILFRLPDWIHFDCNIYKEGIWI